MFVIALDFANFLCAFSGDHVDRLVVQDISLESLLGQLQEQVFEE